MNQISLTFGSTQVIKRIIKKYPERNLVSFSGNNDIVLIDFSNLKSIFKNPINLNVKDYIIHDNNKPFINFTSIILDDDAQKSIDAQFKNLHHAIFPDTFHAIYSLTSVTNPSKRMFLNIWSSYSEYSRWKNENHILNIKDYEGTNNYYYQENYKLVNLNK